MKEDYEDHNSQNIPGENFSLHFQTDIMVSGRTSIRKREKWKYVHT